MNERVNLCSSFTGTTKKKTLSKNHSFNGLYVGYKVVLYE